MAVTVVNVVIRMVRMANTVIFGHISFFVGGIGPGVFVVEVDPKQGHEVVGSSGFDVVVETGFLGDDLGIV